MTALVLRGVRPYGEAPVDIVVADGVITELAPAGTASGEIIDADGLVALPGFVDLHTHLREPGREDAETVATGSRAAALGGFTAVHAMANTEPVADTAGVVEQVVPAVPAVVLDPFAGSGSTLVAAAALGFSFIGIEKDDEYFKIATKRVNAALGRAETEAHQRGAFDLMGELEQE